jgi:hypothetical protein
MGTRMMRIQWLACVAAAAMALAGCSTSGLLEKMGMGGGRPAPAAQPVVQSNNPLAMPPDLRLRQPGTVAENAAAPDPSLAAEPVPQKLASAQPVEAAPAPKRDVYEEYGVSKLKPDGSEKSKAELEKELKAAMLKRKQQQNPNYGTIRNFGAIFSDG